MAMTMPSQTTTAHPPRPRRPYRALTAILSGLVFGALVYKALVTLPAVYPGRWDLVVALVAGLLYASVLPILGAGIAVLALVIPVAQVSMGLLGPLALFAVLSLQCLARREGVLLLAVVVLAFLHPPLALLLPLVPVVAGYLYSRLGGLYVAGFAAFVLVALCIIGGREAAGPLYVGEQNPPFMQSEMMVMIQNEIPFFRDSILDGVHDFHGQPFNLLSFLFVTFLIHWGPMSVLASCLALSELAPRLLDVHLVVQIALWVSGAGLVAWFNKENPTALRRIGVAIGGTSVVAVGHWLLLRLSNLSSWSLTQALLSVAIAGTGVVAGMLILPGWKESRPRIEPGPVRGSVEGAETPAVSAAGAKIGR